MNMKNQTTSLTVLFIFLLSPFGYRTKAKPMQTSLPKVANQQGYRVRLSYWRFFAFSVIRKVAHGISTPPDATQQNASTMMGSKIPRLPPTTLRVWSILQREVRRL
jgi:hypothetical protein